MDIAKAQEVHALMGELSYVRMQRREMSLMLDSCTGKVSVTIPTRWLPGLLESADADIARLEKTIGEI